MKYAMPLTSGQISGQLEHAEQFVFFTADFNIGLSNANIVEVPNNEHGAIVEWLVNQQVERVITSGIDRGVRQLLAENRIKLTSSVADIQVDDNQI